MGICGSQDLTPEEQDKLNKDKSRNKALEEKMRKEKENDTKIHKLLLLGAGESGKSTLFKQMVMLYGNDKKMSEADRKSQIETVFGNVVTNAKVLAEATAEHGSPTTEEGKAAIEFIENLKDDAPIDGHAAGILAQFWSDEGVQGCYDNRANYQLNDSTAYFFNQVEKIGSEGWIPETADILRTRVRTTGIVEHHFTIESQPFKMFDVGGQRNERKKWIHCFENVTAVMFVAAISEFDQVLYEDEHTNRMTEALTLFKEISNSQWFKKTAMMLFLNKKDLFIEKIKTKDMTESKCEELTKFTGNCRSYDETTKFIEKVFKSKVDSKDKQVYAHVTCATDSDNVEHVFNAVKDIILQGALEDAGLA